jgi:hypothetical protein
LLRPNVGWAGPELRDSSHLPSLDLSVCDQTALYLCFLLQGIASHNALAKLVPGVIADSTLLATGGRLGTLRSETWVP